MAALSKRFYSIIGKQRLYQVEFVDFALKKKNFNESNFHRFLVFISSWILVFILGMLYEGIKELRQSIEEKQPNRPSKTEEELETLNTETTKTQIDRSSK